MGDETRIVVKDGGRSHHPVLRRFLPPKLAKVITATLGDSGGYLATGPDVEQADTLVDDDKLDAGTYFYFKSPAAAAPTAGAAATSSGGGGGSVAADAAGRGDDNGSRASGVGSGTSENNTPEGSDNSSDGGSGSNSGSGGGGGNGHSGGGTSDYKRPKGPAGRTRSSVRKHSGAIDGVDDDAAAGYGDPVDEGVAAAAREDAFAKYMLSVARHPAVWKALGWPGPPTSYSPGSVEESWCHARLVDLPRPASIPPM